MKPKPPVVSHDGMERAFELYGARPVKRQGSHDTRSPESPAVALFDTAKIRELHSGKRIQDVVFGDCHQSVGFYEP